MDTQRATSPRAEGEAQREAEREAQREAPGVFARGCALELAARHTGRPALLEYLLARQPRGESKARFEGQVGLRWGEGARGRCAFCRLNVHLPAGRRDAPAFPHTQLSQHTHTHTHTHTHDPEIDS